MADSKPSTIAIPLELPPDETTALAQLVKRVDYETVTRFANPRVTYGGRMENYVMWCGLTILRAALAEAGFAPR
jgi:hypothetical protein